MKAVMGIDPGVRGGVACLDEEGLPFYWKAFTPKMAEKDVLRVLKDAFYFTHMVYGSDVVYIEKVGHIGRKDGRKGLFTFGRVYGFLRGALLALGMEVRSVYPVAWQAKMKCLTGGNKNVSKRRACEIFSAYRKHMTHSLADAFLIAEYGRLRLLERDWSQ